MKDNPHVTETPHRLKFPCPHDDARNLLDQCRNNAEEAEANDEAEGEIESKIHQIGKPSRSTGDSDFSYVKNDHVQVNETDEIASLPPTRERIHVLKRVASSSRSSTARSESRREAPKIFSIGERKGTTPGDVPSNAAVHFASFYENEKLSSRGNDEKPNRRPDPSPRSGPKMEFTRQMVYTLEHSAGTEHYGQQVSALLEKTVEAPEFDLKLPPLDKWAPFNESRDRSYPLWYRDPSKLPETSMRRHSGVENEIREANVRKIDGRASEKSRPVEAKIDGTFDDEDSAARCGSRRFADRYVRSGRSISSVGSEVALESNESSRITETANVSFSGGSECSESSEDGDEDEDEDGEDDAADTDEAKDNDGENEEDDARSSDEDDADRWDGEKKCKTSDSSGWETTEDEDDVVEMKIVNRKPRNEKNRVSEQN